MMLIVQGSEVYRTGCGQDVPPSVSAYQIRAIGGIYDD